MHWIGKRSETTQASSRQEHEAPAPSRHRHSPPLQGSEHQCGAASSPARLPARGIRSFSQGKGRQRCAAMTMPVIPERKDVEVKQCQESREGEHPTTWEALQPWGDGSCSAPCKRPLCESLLPGSLGHKAPTAEAGSSSGLASGWTSVAPWKVKKKRKRK